MQSFPESWEDKQYVVIQKRIINVCCTYCMIIHCEIYLGPKSVGPIRNTLPPPHCRRMIPSFQVFNSFTSKHPNSTNSHCICTLYCSGSLHCFVIALLHCKKDSRQDLAISFEPHLSSLSRSLIPSPPGLPANGSPNTTSHTTHDSPSIGPSKVSCRLDLPLRHITSNEAKDAICAIFIAAIARLR